MSGIERLSDAALSGAAAGASSSQTLAKQASGRFAPVASIVDNPLYSTHNVTPANLKLTRAALAACRAGVRDFRMLVEGDSISAGTGATTPATDVYARRAAQILSQRTGLNYRRGCVPCYCYGAIDPQWTIGSGWTLSNLGPLGSAVSGYNAAAGNAGTLDFTPVDEAGVGVLTDSFTIYAYSGGTSGSFQWAIDGGSYTTQTNTNTYGSGYNSYTVSAGTLGSHVLHIKAAATGNQAYILGAEAVNSTQPGIRYFINGQPSSQTPAGLSALDLTFHKAFKPDLTVFQWNTNEYTLQTALATFQSNVQTVAAQPATYTKPSDVLWLSSPPQGSLLTIPQQSYFDTLDAAADTVGFPVLHIDRQLVSYAISSASPMSLYFDSIHPNTAGHNFMGNCLANVLSLL